VGGRQPRSAAICRGVGWWSNRQSRAVATYQHPCVTKSVASASYLDDRHNIVGRVLKLAHVDIEVPQLVLLRLLQHQVAPLSHCIDALQVAGGVEVGIGRARQRDLGDVRGGCGVLGHVGVFGVAVEEEGRVTMVGGVFLGGGAVVAVVPAGEEAHGIYMCRLLYAAVPVAYLAGGQLLSGNQCGAARANFGRLSGRRLSRGAVI